VGEAAQLAGGQLSEPAFHQVQPGRAVGPAGPARLPPQTRFRRADHGFGALAETEQADGGLLLPDSASRPVLADLVVPS
jgi:hypothetical protein